MTRLEPIEPPAIAKRRPDAHKGDFGRLLLLAGSPNMTGAAYLCAEAAVLSGAGLVTLGVPARIHPWLAARAVAWMTLPLPDTPSGAFSARAEEPAMAFLSRCKAFLIGPGLGMDPSTGKFAAALAHDAPLPGVIDADGLNHLSGAAALLKSAAGPRVITPHPGEFSRLTGLSVGEIQRDRTGAASEFASRTGCVVLLKGKDTVVTNGRNVYINGTGNPGMASGGVGDVLSGVITALLGTGMTAMEAAAAGACIHGIAGDLATEEFGEISCSAGKILETLPRAFREYSGRGGS